MTQDEFNKAVSQAALDIQRMDTPKTILSCACIEAACQIAIDDDKEEMMVEKLRQVASLLENGLFYDRA